MKTVAKKPAHKPAKLRATIVRKKKPKATPHRVPETDHPLQYLISGAEALPPTLRKQSKKRREQTLEEFMGF